MSGSYALKWDCRLALQTKTRRNYGATAKAKVFGSFFKKNRCLD
jgi:hypothetical protein